MSFLREVAIENLYNNKKHLYIFEVTGTRAYTGKGSRTYKPVQICAVNREHAISKARQLKGLKVIGAVTVLGQVRKTLEDRYFRRYEEVLTKLYNLE